MLVSNVSMTNITNCSTPRKNINQSTSAVSFEGAAPLKAFKLPVKGIGDFFKNLKIGETVKKMFNVVKNSKVVQSCIGFFKNIGNSKVIQAPINFVKNIFKKPAP